MIKVIASGHLGSDATFKQVNENFNVTQFSIASTRKVKGEDVTTWLNCSKFNSEKLAPYLTKGTKVIVSGDLEIRKHEDKYYTTLIVHELEFAGMKQESNQQENNTEQTTDSKDESDNSDDLPF